MCRWILPWWFMTVFLAANWISGFFGCDGVPNRATSDLWSTVSSWPGYLIVIVEPEVFISAAPSGMASYSPCSCFLLRVVARVFLANFSSLLFWARGCSGVCAEILKVRGISPLSLSAVDSIRCLDAFTSSSLSNVSCIHRSSEISSSLPMMLSSK